MKVKMYIKELKQSRKINEVDMECSLRLITEDNQIMALSAYPSDTIFDVTIEPEEK